jgi:hypothetical protein
MESEMISMRIKTTALAGCVALASTAFIGGPAMADPPLRGNPVEVTCGSDTFEVVVAGNGSWTPAHDLNSNKVWQPVAFDNEFFRVFNAKTGELIVQEGPGDLVVKMGNRNGVKTQNCSFSGSDGPFFDEELGFEIRIEFSGDVTLHTK